MVILQNLAVYWPMSSGYVLIAILQDYNSRFFYFVLDQWNCKGSTVKDTRIWGDFLHYDEELCSDKTNHQTRTSKKITQGFINAKGFFQLQLIDSSSPSYHKRRYDPPPQTNLSPKPLEQHFRSRRDSFYGGAKGYGLGRGLGAG